MQSRLQSLIESIANVVIGYLVALGAQLVVFPFVGLEVSLSQNLLIGAIFTAVSLARSYCVRRLFNRLHARQNPLADGIAASVVNGASWDTPRAGRAIGEARNSTKQYRTAEPLRQR